MNTEIKQYGTTDALLFLDGKGMDGNGRYISEYFDFDRDKWEDCHNHVQWAFPSHIASRFNINAPVVHDMDAFALEMTINASNNAQRLMEAYLDSLGFVMGSDDYYRFDPTSERNKIWLTPFNHNYQRISRLLNFLYHTDIDMCHHVFGEFLRAAELAKDWVEVDAFNRRAPVITAETLLFWSKAAIGEL